MLHKVTFRALAIAVCGGLLACDAGALTVGQARGAVLVGRPLDLAIPVTLDKPDTEAFCAAGDLYYGQRKVERGVDVRWQAAGARDGTVHVSSAVPVDEPMVTLYLRVGCDVATTRRFVLLAEVPPQEEKAAPAAPLLPSAGTGTRAAPARATEAAGPAAVARAAAGTRAPRHRAAATRPARIGKPEARARLRLEPLDVAIDRDPVLRLTSDLGAPPPADAQRRQAAAALWAALQKPPEQAVQDALRLQGVERELASLRELTRQNAAAVAQMRAQVEQARESRTGASVLVAVLSAVLAGLLGWIGWRSYAASRVERVNRWFEANGEPLHAIAPLPTAPAPLPPPLPASPLPAAVPRVPAAAAAGAAAAARPQEPLASSHGPLRMVGVEELIDLHEKADFFLAIGEYGQAISLLESHVHGQVETSALAWMDLLELYHSRGKRAEYETLRAEFQQRFAVEVPDFDHFGQPTASLENYGRALSRIVALWPSPRVLDVIEESIFRKPGLPGAEPFSLEAYRELVLLHHIAREVTQPEERAAAGDTAPNGAFPATSVQPLNAVEARAGAEPDRERLLIPPPSARLGLDIDLGSLPVEEEPPRGEGARELPPLDFDVSAFEPAKPDPAPRS